MTATTVAGVKTVVVADDTAFVRERFKAALEDAGHRVAPVASAAELLGTIRRELGAIDLVVVDLRMPHANGVELLKAIRRIDGGRLPLLVFSGTIASADEVRALTGLGIAGYINEGWFRVDQPGTYRGQCAELCGKDHGFMPIVVEVLPKAEFDAWLAEQKTARAVAAN